MAILGLRAANHFDPSWDSLAYHLPFAAYRAGVDIPFHLDDGLIALYEGAPPLPELAMGVIWRLTDSVASVGLGNYLALALFVGWCGLVLRASFWVVTLVSLSAPLVIIHTSVAYIDLLTNAFLAVGAATLVYLWLFPERATRLMLVGGLLGLAAACWSKYTMTPFAGVLFLLYVPVAWRTLVALRWKRTVTLVVIVGVAAVAAMPYIRNLVEYGNPFWPFRTPLIGSLFPYLFDNDSPSRPPGLAQASSIEAFVRSLFEIDLPWSYAARARWSIDSGGDVGEAYRMGGFWGLGSLFFLLAMLGLLWAHGRRGHVVAIGALVTLGLVALVPQSNELRYWMFIPLMWAAIIGMLFRPLAARRTALATALGIAIIGMFTYMVVENRTYYSPIPTVGWTLRGPLVPPIGGRSSSKARRTVLWGCHRCRCC